MISYRLYNYKFFFIFDDLNLFFSFELCYKVNVVDLLK